MTNAAASVKTTKRRAGAEDVQVGRIIRALRLQRGWSESALAFRVGLTFQQVQEYEKGINRVSAGRLQRIADTFETPDTVFYDGKQKGRNKGGSPDPALALIRTKGAMRLLRSYASISSRTSKNALVVVAKSLSNKRR